MTASQIKDHWKFGGDVDDTSETYSEIEASDDKSHSPRIVLPKLVSEEDPTEAFARQACAGIFESLESGRKNKEDTVI